MINTSKDVFFLILVYNRERNKRFNLYKILVIEDDEIIARSIKNFMIQWGYQVETCSDFQNVLTHFVEMDPQLVLLDISLPFYNGFYWCAEIRKLSKVPILFVSSMSDNMNMVMAMNMGGDDFISKPFDLSVLHAKIQAILRRTYDFNGLTNILEHRNVFLNLNDSSLTYQENKIELTKNEFRIIQMLFEHNGKIISRESLMTRLWENDSYVDENTLSVNMNRLRKKCENIGLIDFIVTKKGIGYMIE